MRRHVSQNVEPHPMNEKCMAQQWFSNGSIIVSSTNCTSFMRCLRVTHMVREFAMDHLHT